LITHRNKSEINTLTLTAAFLTNIDRLKSLSQLAVTNKQTFNEISKFQAKINPHKTHLFLTTIRVMH